MTQWTAEEVPSQRGRLAVVTGTGGLGFECALALAHAGANVVIAGRDGRKGAEAVARIHHAVPTASVRFGKLDLASLESIATFATQLAGEQDRVDILINNAGVMTPPQRRETLDGFELQLGTNYLGHFALTAHLLPMLKKGHAPRVVTLSSVAARKAKIDFDDLQALRHYQPMPVYGQSKLACLMFARELSRRSAAHDWGVESLAAHPGISRTDLLPNGSGNWSFAGMARRWLWFLFQPAAQGAWPALFAATAPEALDGHYYGPNKLGETRGNPAEAKLPPAALNDGASGRLWQLSEKLTGTMFA